MTTARLHPVEDLSQMVSDLLIAIPSAAVLESLSAIDPYSLPPALRIDFLAALERQDGWLFALKQRAITAVAGAQASVGEGPLFGVDEAEREDVSTALRLAPSTAQMRIDIARNLVNNLPNTCSALALGEISSAHATVIARETASAIHDGMSESAIFDIELEQLHMPNSIHLDKLPTMSAAQLLNILPKSLRRQSPKQLLCAESLAITIQMECLPLLQYFLQLMLKLS